MEKLKSFFEYLIIGLLTSIAVIVVGLPVVFLIGLIITVAGAVLASGPLMLILLPVIGYIVKQVVENF